jgi:quinol---cytochrome c reductase cytochrome c subunit, bacillus type
MSSPKLGRRVASVPVCAIAICGCGASTGSSAGTERSTPAALGAHGSASGPTALSVRPPRSVERAGGRQLAEFELGRVVVGQSGCLACHRIGDQGPGEPGPALTHIGSMMPERSIERVLIDAEPPMPSFGQLPRAQFRALLAFLSLLRCPGSRRGLSPHGC